MKSKCGVNEFAHIFAPYSRDIGITKKYDYKLDAVVLSCAIIDIYYIYKYIKRKMHKKFNLRTHTSSVLYLMAQS